MIPIEEPEEIVERVNETKYYTVNNFVEECTITGHSYIDVTRSTDSLALKRQFFEAVRESGYVVTGVIAEKIDHTDFRVFVREE